MWHRQEFIGARRSPAAACRAAIGQRLFASILLLRLALGVACTAAAEGEAAVDIRMRMPAQRDLVLPWTLSIAGTWPNACAPEVDAVNVEGNDIRIDLRSRRSLCDSTPTAFQLSASPAKTSGITMLPQGSYRVSVYAATNPHGASSLWAFALIDNTYARPVALPESGYWWAQAEPGADVSTGTGLMIELQGHTLTIAALSYESSGEPVWYLGTGLLQNSIAHIPMLRAQGGSSLFSSHAAAPQAASALTLDLEFQSSARAVAWFSRASSDGTNGLDLHALTLARMAFADPPDGRVWQGDWILVPDDPLKPTQRLHFDQMQTQSEQSFRLSDSNSDSLLSCWRDAQRLSAPPQSCTLQSGDGRTLAQFTAVAIGRLEGLQPDNGGVRLIRLSP